MLNLMYITNKPDIAEIAEKSGVDRIFIDLEIIGKEERQGNLDTVISRHNIEDVKKIKRVLKKAKLLVRVNPIHENSINEIDYVIEQGADIIMLPFFKTIEEVTQFIKIIDGRVKTCLLLETPEAVDILDEIIQIKGIDEIHIGLNDLHLGYKKKFMFELITDGTVEKICNKISKTKISYGFGGIARVGTGTLPAENIIIEHYRLNSSMVILSRSFCNTNTITDLNVIKKLFDTGVIEIRKIEEKSMSFTNKEYQENINTIHKKIEMILKSMEENKA